MISSIKRMLQERVKQSLKRTLRLILGKDLDRIKDLTIALAQLGSIIKHEQSILLPPPKHLQIRVVGRYYYDFIRAAYSTYDQLNSFLAVINKQLSDFQSILDFGCGCGRITRAFKRRLPSHAFYGIDIDPEAVAWLKENYESLADFQLTSPLPPTLYKDHMFDFIYSISMFTHLPEDMQFAWLEELRRIAKPGAYLILTTHGESHYKKLKQEEQAKLNEKGFFYRESAAVTTEGLPAFYQVTYHSPDYIRAEWKKYFDIVEIQPNGLDNHQDMILLRKRRAEGESADICQTFPPMAAYRLPSSDCRFILGSRPG